MSVICVHDRFVTGFDDLGAPAVALTPPRVRLGLAAFDVRHMQLDAKGQDAFLVRDGFVAIADGSTPLDRSTGGLVAAFANAALSTLSRLRHKDTASQFAAAIAAVGGAYTAQTTPTCGVGLVQARGRDLEAVALADVMVLIKHVDGSFTMVRDERVGFYDNRSANAMQQLMAAGATPEEARAGIQPLIADQFAHHRNLPGGYWVFANDPQAAREITAVGVALDSVDSILICSDGFARLWEVFGLYPGPEALMNAALTTPLEEMGATLRAVETLMDSMRSHPRTSRYDDTTAIVLTRPRA